MSDSTVSAAKAALRSQVRARRRTLRDAGAATRSQLSTAYAKVLIEHLGERAAGTITAYESWSTEPPTEGLIAALRSLGWRVIVPDTLPDLDLSWHDVAAPDVDLGRGAIAEADVVLIPGLSVDQHGYRLGQGGGCYDRVLLRKQERAPVIAMIFDHELVTEVPREEHDCQVDAVLTADALLTRNPVTGTIAP